MPQWAGSCWYYLRYLDSKNGQSFVGKDAERYWMGLQAPQPSTLNPQPNPRPAWICTSAAPSTPCCIFCTRVSGTRFCSTWATSSTAEPFFKLVNQGLILGEDGQKMSKSRGNVVNPDDILKEFGADAFRLYEMFMGPLQDTKPWNTQGVAGVYKFLGRVWRLFVDEKSENRL